MTFNMSRAQRREAARHIAKEAGKLPAHLVQIPRDQWPSDTAPGRLEVWRSRDYLVQVFAEPPPCLVRLSINRTVIAGQRWVDGISWDDLQRLKAECGYGGHDAVEVFPHALDVINVANMRHLWVMGEPLTFAWRRG